MIVPMGIVKVEIKVPEAVKAIESFRRERKAALAQFAQEVKDAVSQAFNHMLHAEMTLFLGQTEQIGNKRNGYYERQYALKGIGAIRVRMPIDRKHAFRSEILPRHEQIDPRLKEDLAVLHLAGISTRTLAMMSKRILGVDVSPDTVTKSLGVIEDQALSFLTRPLKRPYWALYIDGTYFSIQRRGSTQKEPSLVVLGLDDQNRMSILAVEPGTKDNVEAWRAAFAELIRRGLDVQAVKIGVMDGLPGLENLFRETFPSSVTARCWVHSLVNAIAKTPQRLRPMFKTLAQRVMYATGEEAARKAFSELKEAMGSDAMRAVACLEKDLDSLTVHYQFDASLWRALKTTNAIERVHREFKRRTKTMDTLGERTLQMVIAFTAIRLEFNWQLIPVNSKVLNNLLPAKTNQLEATLEKLMH